MYSVLVEKLTVGAIAGIAVSALVVVLTIIFLTVAVPAVIAGWKRQSNSGTFDLKTDVSVVKAAFRHLMLHCEFLYVAHRLVS